MDKIAVALARILVGLALVLAAIVIAGMLTGCGGSVHRAQISTQTTIASAARGLDSTDRAVTSAMRPTVNRAVLAVQTRCAGGTCDPVEELRGELEDLYVTVDGLEATWEALAMLQSAAEVWYATDELPDDWGPLCDALGESVAHLVGLLDQLGVNVPGVLAAAGPAVSGICRIGATIGGAL